MEVSPSLRGVSTPFEADQITAKKKTIDTHLALSGESVSYDSPDMRPACSAGSWYIGMPDSSLEGGRQ